MIVDDRPDPYDDLPEPAIWEPDSDEDHYRAWFPSWFDPNYDGRIDTE